MTWDASMTDEPAFSSRKIPCARCQKTLVHPSYHAPGAVHSLCDACVVLVNTSDEETKIRSWLPRLEKYFHIEREVTGSHMSGKRMRIDTVIRPIDVSDWKNPHVAFGVEFKKQETADLSGDGSRWLAQCADYANTKWDRYGYLYILIPGGINPSSPGLKHGGDYLPRLAYHLGIGELKRDGRDGFTILLAGSDKIWMETTGPYVAKRHGLERKFGSR